VRKAGFLISIGFILIMIGFVFLIMQAGSIDTFFFVFPFFFFAGTGSADLMIILVIIVFIAFAVFAFCIPSKLDSNRPLTLGYEHQTEMQQYCPYCHSKISNDAIYCHKCGKRILDRE
jgi:uncharacterized paraquat-inducible protein A